MFEAGSKSTSDMFLLACSNLRRFPLALVEIPDVVFFDRTGKLLAIGELNVPWVDSHSLEDAINDDDRVETLRTILAQPALYMRHLGLRYGFMSTYNGTVLLRQVLVDGEWRLQYSPVIKLETVSKGAAPPNPWKDSVSVRECMFYLGGASNL